MFDKIMDSLMNLRFSWGWYLLIIFGISLLTALSHKLKTKTGVKYRRIERILIFAPIIIFISCSMLAVVAFLVFGFSLHWISNYTGFLLIVGPLVIASLIIYAVIQERKNGNKE